MFPQRQRVITYIDGFNLYFGLKEKMWQKYYWLDMRKLSLNLLKPNQTLTAVKYFTSRISSKIGQSGKSKRQNTYLEALATLKDTTLFFGKYEADILVCQHCGKQNALPKEKQTDVNIANELLVDAHLNNFDTAILISGDSDLLAPVRTIVNNFTSKSLIIAFPPKRVSVDLKNSGAIPYYISRRNIARSQLPLEIKKHDGFILTRPKEWS